MKTYLLLPILSAYATLVAAGQPDGGGRVNEVSEPEMLGLLAVAGVALAVNYFRKRK